jgi:uncharacterized protein YqeY
VTSLVEQLRAALPIAMRARDAPAVSALRGALAAVGNAEAVDPLGHEHAVTSRTTLSEHVAGSYDGLGTADVARRELSEDDVRRIVRRESDARLDDAAVLEAHGQHDRARRLRAKAAVLHGVLDDSA